MVQRIIGVFQLDVPTFEQIEHDTTATGQAAGVVAIAAVCQAIGRSFSAFIWGGGVGAGFLVTIVAAFIGWVVWSALTYWIGTTLFEGQADLGEMLRVIGFANAPLILAIIPCFGTLVGGIWALVAGFVAIRQGLDLDNTKTFVTIIIGFLAYVVIAAIASIFTGGMAAIPG
ncbi:MAG: YIP1 family protein [Salinibacter sp.]|uniref:YIP1 family protein n=1 Tax=Salinibacter sp. TaxID=2065818 RepID=UPI0035D4D062